MAWRTLRAPFKRAVRPPLPIAARPRHISAVFEPNIGVDRAMNEVEKSDICRSMIDDARPPRMLDGDDDDDDFIMDDEAALLLLLMRPNATALRNARLMTPTTFMCMSLFSWRNRIMTNEISSDGWIER